MSQLDFFDAAERAKVKAIAQAGENSEPFVDRAYEIIERLAGVMREFSSLEVWARYSGPRPKHPRAMGAAFVKAQRAGLIEPTQKFIKSGRASDHNQYLRVWRSRG